jgi:predicted transcriptional regulator YdeE
MSEQIAQLTVSIVEHGEKKLIGLASVGLNEMGSKFQCVKDGLLSASKHLPHIVEPNIHYALWSNSPSQDNPDTHVYILCTEVSSFEGIPDWFLKFTLPPQKSVVAEGGNWETADRAIGDYLRENKLETDVSGRKYVICERYNHNSENGYAQYSRPLV